MAYHLLLSYEQYNQHLAILLLNVNFKNVQWHIIRYSVVFGICLCVENELSFSTLSQLWIKKEPRLVFP